MQALNIIIFGIIAAVSLDMEIVFVFHSIWVCLHPDLNTHALGLCRIFLSEKVTAP